MFDYLRRYQDIFFPLGLWLISLVILSTRAYSEGPSRSNPFFRAVTATVSYPQRGITYTARGIRDVWNNYIYLAHLRKQNLKLQKQLALLTMENFQLKEIAHENERLRKLVGFKEKVPYNLVPAEVIAEDLSSQSKTITMNKGSRDNVRPGMAAVTHEGLVGQVIDEPGASLTPFCASVLLIVDPTSRVAVMIQRTRARGIVKGTGSFRHLDLLYLEPHADVEVGDVIITSGLGGVFPKGLMVGTVTEVKKDPSAINPDVKVKPGVDFTRQEEILLVSPISEGD
jgi:rod shape-determining protein MreC